MTDLINGPNTYMSQVLNYINNVRLSVSTAKSTVILFTPDSDEYHLHPQVKLADQVLPLKKRRKVLVVTLDTHLTFTQHCNNIAVRVQQRNNVLKALTVSTYCCINDFQAVRHSMPSTTTSIPSTTTSMPSALPQTAR